MIFKIKKSSLSCKMAKILRKFDFVFREIAKFLPKFRYRVLRNFAKFEGNFAKIS